MITKIRISGFGPIKDAALEFNKGKVLLYGHNGAGKSTAILAIESIIEKLAGLQAGKYGELMRRGAGVVEAVVQGVRYKLAEEMPQVLDAALAHADACGVAIYRRNRAERLDVRRMVIRDPRVGELLNRYAYAVVTRMIYYDSALLPTGEWVPLGQLGYGHRRLLSILAALALGVEIIAVEAADMGLHFDLMAFLIKQISSSKSFAVLEAHNMHSVKVALQHEWDVYYVRGGAFHRINDLKDVKKLVEAEAEAYTLF